MLVSEIFEKVCKAKSKKERVKVLQENQSQAVFAVLQINYNPTYKNKAVTKFNVQLAKDLVKDIDSRMPA